jgi:DNA-binding transcriptional MerR regulator
MRDIRYIISEASKRIEVEQHTLRYWEEELDLYIPRNEMGHRYYQEEDIEVFKTIKVLKEKGYQLRAIKMLLPDIQKLNNQDDVILGDNNLASLPIHMTAITENDRDLLLEEKSAERLEQFKAIMNRLVTEALQNNNKALSATVSDAVTSNVIKKVDYLLRIKEEREEERFKQFDRTMREIQNSRAEVAATKSEKNKKKKGIFYRKVI